MTSYCSWIRGDKNDLTIQRLAIAVDALENGRFKEAVTILEELVETTADDPDILMYLGIAYVQNEQPEDALDILEKAKDLVEDHCVLYLFLGRAQKAVGHLEDAEHTLRKAIELDSLQPEAWEDLAGVLYARGKYAESIACIEDALVYFPEAISLRALNAMAYNRLGDRTGALCEWEYIHELAPDSKMGLINYAYTLLMLQKPQDAAPFVRKAIEVAPSDHKSWVLSTELAMQQEKYNLAFDNVQKALELNSKCTHVLGRYTVIKNELGMSDYSETLAEFEKQIADQSQRWRGLYYVYKHLGMTDEAIKSLQDGTKEDCDAAAPWIALAHEYAQMGMDEESLEAWKVSIRLRNYIKVHCDACDKDMRIPAKTSGGKIRIPDIIKCNGCGEHIPLPQGLSCF
ncbi:MAG: tetratricopeptide repeat protein [Candidatus Lokiarchaeota archaeon]|nr:tetratricopeptide repeat protein [Candidatus Lokiarchaeota archaeon]